MERGLMGRHSYRLREEFFDEMDKFYSENLKILEQEPIKRPKMEEMTFEDYLVRVELEKEFDKIWANTNVMIPIESREEELVIKKQCLEAFILGRLS